MLEAIIARAVKPMHNALDTGEVSDGGISSRRKANPHGQQEVLVRPGDFGQGPVPGSDAAEPSFRPNDDVRGTLERSRGTGNRWVAVCEAKGLTRAPMTWRHKRHVVFYWDGYVIQIDGSTIRVARHESRRPGHNSRV